MKKLFAILIFWPGMALSVLSQPVTRLTPEAPEGHFEMGREYIALENDHVRVELGFDGFFEGFMVFDVVVFNDTGDSLFLDPSGFHYLLLESADADSSLLPPFKAVHPERILQHYDQAMETCSTVKSINSIFGFIETGIGILASASSFLATENPGTIVDGVFNTVGTAGHYVSQDRKIGNDLDQIFNEKEVVSAEILRPGEIPPGKVVSGYVFFPVFEETGFIMFCIPLEDQLFQFVYKQYQEVL